MVNNVMEKLKESGALRPVETLARRGFRCEIATVGAARSARSTLRRHLRRPIASGVQFGGARRMTEAPTYLGRSAFDPRTIPPGSLRLTNCTPSGGLNSSGGCSPILMSDIQKPQPVASGFAHACRIFASK